MNLSDATLVFLSESADQPVVAELARSVHGRLVNGEPVGYQALDELIGEASGKGVLRAMSRKYSPTAYEAILAPVLGEIGRTKPIRSTRPEWRPAPGEDPLSSRS